MKLAAVFAALFMMFVNDSMAQRRPIPRRPMPPRPRPIPMPPRRPIPMPRPMPRPMPAPRAEYTCVGADLYHFNWLTHRFRFSSDCRQALREVHYQGRFCDEGTMYDRNGNFQRQYDSEWECRNWLK